jgi:sn-glycerol 3-phosphate transport system substrate-binding protein
MQTKRIGEMEQTFLMFLTFVSAFNRLKIRMTMKFRNLIASVLLAAFIAFTPSAWAQTEIQWWHAMEGALGETVNQIARDYNASQSTYKLTPVYKGGYEDTMTAGIAA